MGEDRKSTYERTLRGVHLFHLCFTVVLSHTFCFARSFALHTTAGCLLLVQCLFHVAHDSYPGIGVPVVLCGRRVVISGS